LLQTKDIAADNNMFFIIKTIDKLIGIYDYSVLELLVLYWHVTGPAKGTPRAGVAPIARLRSDGAADGGR
jgi:hypothetical protein